MTRVLEVLGRSAGGIARHVAQVAELMDARDGLRIDIAGPPDLPVEMPKIIHRVVIPDGPVKGHRHAIKVLRALIKEHDYEVVHAHGLRAGIDSSLAARGQGAFVFVTIHNLVLPEIAGRRAALYRVAEDLAVRLSGRTFAVSEDIASHLRRRLGGTGDRVEVMHLGAGPKPELTRTPLEVREALGLSADQSLIVTASRLAPQKSLETMLQAVAELPETCVLGILGVGPLEARLREVAEQLGVGERIRWLGFRSDIADHIAAADVFCLSSIWEGVPLAAMEAIQLETPIVATAVGGMPELVVDGHSGRLVEPRDPRALADALRRVISAPELRKTYVNNALIDLEKNFSTERMLARLREAYKGVPRA